MCLLVFFSLSAIIEHTNKVIYLEDDDVAVVNEGKLYVHRIKRKAGEDSVRVIQTLQMELQQIMKGNTNTTETTFKLMFTQKWKFHLLTHPCCSKLVWTEYNWYFEEANCW